MLKLHELSIKNFLSFGNNTQYVNFGNSDLVLVLGENLDLGGMDNRNGVGKSGLVNALSYALYGASLSNIRKDNLINATNMKNMLVTLTFEVNGVDYRIERGRKPGIFKFIKNGVEKESPEDETQGEGRNTQFEIEKLIGISYDMFKH
ncbi:MAG: AAA family ATPase, partial [Planktothrix sp.]